MVKPNLKKLKRKQKKLANKLKRLDKREARIVSKKERLEYELADINGLLFRFGRG